jgi:RimJ/RimL family protein N-acetyltransferase
LHIGFGRSIAVKHTKPQISTPLIRAVQCYSNSEVYFLQSLDDSLKVSSWDLSTIVKCCNEPLIYKYLFKDSLNGEPYTIDDARNFIRWANLGWKERRYFVFLIKNPGDKIVGCIELASAILTESAIGYWETSTVTGVMTNVLSCLIEIAKDAGYRKLSARVEPDNVRSQKLLERLHFIHTSSSIERMTFLGKQLGKRKTFHYYERKLIPY